MKILEIPYFSQWDSTAGLSKNDCGPVSVSMVLAFYGIKTTADEVFKRTGAGQGLISISQLKKSISSYGLDSRYEKDRDWNRIKDLIDSNTPPIALVHYGDLSSRQDKGYHGGHFFVITGYRDDGVFVNDPDFWGVYREHGKNHFYPKDEFLKAWNNSYQDGNPRNSLLIIKENHSQNEDFKECLDQHEELVTENVNLKDQLEKLEKEKKILSNDLVKMKKKKENEKKLADEWRKISEVEDVNSFDELDKKIRAYKDSSNCDSLLEVQKKNFVKREKEIKEQCKRQKDLLRRHLIDPMELETKELILLLFGIKPKQFEQNKKNGT